MACLSLLLEPFQADMAVCMSTLCAWSIATVCAFVWVYEWLEIFKRGYMDILSVFEAEKLIGGSFITTSNFLFKAIYD